VRTPSISRTPVIALRFPARSRRHIRGRRERGDTVEVTPTTTRNPQRRWKWLVPMNRNSAHGTSFISSAVTVNPAPLVVFRVLLAYESEHLGDMADALVESAEDDADDVAEPLTGGYGKRRLTLYLIIVNTAAKAITAVAVKMMISAMMSLIGSLPGTVVPPPPVG
jgi:hypothetical protein